MSGGIKFAFAVVHATEHGDCSVEEALQSGHYTVVSNFARFVLHVQSDVIKMGTRLYNVGIQVL